MRRQFWFTVHSWYQEILAIIYGRGGTQQLWLRRRTVPSKRQEWVAWFLCDHIARLREKKSPMQSLFCFRPVVWGLLGPTREQNRSTGTGKYYVPTSKSNTVTAEPHGERHRKKRTAFLWVKRRNQFIHSGRTHNLSNEIFTAVVSASGTQTALCNEATIIFLVLSVPLFVLQ